jgi:hypothetical protein
MGSKRAWGAALAGPVGYFAGRYLDKKDKKQKRLEAAAQENTSENEKAEDTATGGGDPFADTTEAKKKKVNTLFAGSNVGALSGAGSSQGSLTLGS